MLVSFFAMNISDFSYFIVIKLLKISNLSKFLKGYLMLKILNNDKFTTAQNRHFLVSLKTPILNTLPFRALLFALCSFIMCACFAAMLFDSKTRSGYRFSHSSIHSLDEASLGMRQSPRGLRQQLPTLGPSGRQLRLNCCAKKRLKNVLSQCFMTSSEYSLVWPSVWLNAFFARKKIFEGRKPFRRT